MEPQGCSPGGEGAGGLSRTALSPVKQLPLWGLWASSPPTVCLCDSCPPFDLRWAKPARGGGPQSCHGAGDGYWSQNRTVGWEFGARAALERADLGEIPRKLAEGLGK